MKLKGEGEKIFALSASLGREGETQTFVVRLFCGHGGERGDERREDSLIERCFSSLSLFTHPMMTLLCRRKGKNKSAAAAAMDGVVG